MALFRIAWQVFLRCGEVFFNMVVTHVPSHFVRKNYLRLWGVKIGKRTYLLRGCQIFRPHLLTIGARTSIGFRCMIDARGGIVIGDNVVIASDTHLLPGGHGIDDPEFADVKMPITIEDYVWLASRVTVMGGLTIGRGAVVAGCACVVGDVPPLTVVGGVPAKQIGTRDADALQYDPSWFPLLY